MNPSAIQAQHAQQADLAAEDITNSHAFIEEVTTLLKTLDHARLSALAFQTRWQERLTKNDLVMEMVDHLRRALPLRLESGAFLISRPNDVGGYHGIWVNYDPKASNATVQDEAEVNNGEKPDQSLAKKDDSPSKSPRKRSLEDDDQSLPASPKRQRSSESDSGPVASSGSQLAAPPLALTGPAKRPERPILNYTPPIPSLNRGLQRTHAMIGVNFGKRIELHTERQGKILLQQQIDEDVVEKEKVKAAVARAAAAARKLLATETAAKPASSATTTATKLRSQSPNKRSREDDDDDDEASRPASRARSESPSAISVSRASAPSPSPPPRRSRRLSPKDTNQTPKSK